MEKALAKMYGSYENIAKGACAEGLQTLTGEPCDVIYLRLSNTKLESGVNSLYISNPYGDSKAHIWSKIFQSKNAGCLMTTLCFNESITDTNFDKIGLLNRHIYSILDVREFNDTANISSPFKLLKLRNPWGHKEWKGKWSNKWPDWPPDLKMQIAGVYKKDDGCFWISFEDVLNYFYDVTICKVRPEWLESRQSSCFYDYSNGIEVFLVTIEQNGIYEFEIELFSTGIHNNKKGPIPF
jgi:calpain-15